MKAKQQEEIIMEKYIVLQGYYDCYAVSNLGNVKNLRTGNILNPTVRKDGYKSVLLSRDGKKMSIRVHQLVAQYFIEKSQNNVRIASNLNLDNKILSLFEKHINPFVLSELDYKIHNINTLANDTSLSPILRASNAMKKFSRLCRNSVRMKKPCFKTLKRLRIFQKGFMGCRKKMY